MWLMIHDINLNYLVSATFLYSNTAIFSITLLCCCNSVAKINLYLKERKLNSISWREEHQRICGHMAQISQSLINNLEEIPWSYTNIAFLLNVQHHSTVDGVCSNYFRGINNDFLFPTFFPHLLFGILLGWFSFLQCVYLFVC